MMYQAGLVLEGGAMKGVYTAGVLDFFLDAGIDFAKCYGVSAGACCLADNTAFLPTILRIKTIGDFRAC